MEFSLSTMFVFNGWELCQPFFYNSEIYINEWNPMISLAGLANWVLSFYFWGIEDFIKTPNDRKR